MDRLTTHAAMFMTDQSIINNYKPYVNTRFSSNTRQILLYMAKMS